MEFSPLTLVAIAYWLALAAWFGGTLFVTIAAPVVFRVVRGADPTLPTVLSVNLEGQHATLLAGRIVAELLYALGRLELVCAVILLVSLGAEWAAVAAGGRDFILPLVRTMLFLSSALLAWYGSRVVRPKAEAARQEYIDNADEPEIANPAIDRFDALHRESVTVLQLTLFALLGLVLFSAIGFGLRGGTTFDFGG